MTTTDVMQIYEDAVEHVCDRIKEFGTRPGKSFTRSRLLKPDTMLRSLVAMAAESTKNELLELFDEPAVRPTAQGWAERLDQLQDDAVKALPDQFNHLYDEALQSSDSPCIFAGYQLLAVDGCTFRYPSDTRFSGEKYSMENGHSKPTYGVHLTALFDLLTDMYTDGVIQSAHEKNEFGAFCTMVDRTADTYRSDRHIIFIADRGFCSYNNMAHIQEAGHYFLLRAKDVTGKGILHNLNLPSEGTFDTQIDLELTRSQSHKVATTHEHVRYINRKTAFDFLEPGTLETYVLHFRVVRILLPNGEYEALVTNLPAEEFPPEVLKLLYNKRWSEETSFRELKNPLGTIQFHSKKPNRVKQEIWANMLRYNISISVGHVLAERRTSEAVVSDARNETDIRSALQESRLAVFDANSQYTRYGYSLNFSMIVLETTLCIRRKRKPDQIDADSRDAVVPIRPDRSYPRLQTAHFRKPRVFTYRAA